MTPEQFRNNEDLRAELRQILEHPTLKMAMEAMRIPCIDAAANEEPIVSVRRLSFLSGFNSFPVVLSSLTVPPSPVMEDPQPEWRAEEMQ